MPMSGVRLQLLPWHGALSTRSLAPAASTAGLLASMASAGSLEPLGRYGLGGLPTVTLASMDAVTVAPAGPAPASAGTLRAAVEAINAAKIAGRRIIIDPPSWRPERIPSWRPGGTYRRRLAVTPRVACRVRRVKPQRSFFTP